MAVVSPGAAMKRYGGTGESGPSRQNYQWEEMRNETDFRRVHAVVSAFAKVSLDEVGSERSLQ
jgi:hypothetical protein